MRQHRCAAVIIAFATPSAQAFAVFSQNALHSFIPGQRLVFQRIVLHIEKLFVVLASFMDHVFVAISTEHAAKWIVLRKGEAEMAFAPRNHKAVKLLPGDVIIIPANVRRHTPVPATAISNCTGFQGGTVGRPLLGRARLAFAIVMSLPDRSIAYTFMPEIQTDVTIPGKLYD